MQRFSRDFDEYAEELSRRRRMYRWQQERKEAYTRARYPDIDLNPDERWKDYLIFAFGVSVSTTCVRALNTCGLHPFEGTMYGSRTGHIHVSLECYQILRAWSSKLRIKGKFDVELYRHCREEYRVSRHDERCLAQEDFR
jgi:hypothetical protein